MSLIQSKQVSKNIAAWVGMKNLTVSSSASLNITTALTTILATAGNGGVSVPVTPGGNYQTEGIITGSTAAVLVYSNTTGQPIIVSGEEVYGIITYSSSVYTVSFYTFEGGVQTSVTINQAVDLFIPYCFTFEHLPFDALLSVQTVEPGGGSAGGGGTAINDYVTATGTDTFPNLTQLPLHPASVLLFVNGQCLTAGVNFTATGQVISIGAGQAAATGYHITPSDTCFFRYEY